MNTDTEKARFFEENEIPGLEPLGEYQRNGWPARAAAKIIKAIGYGDNYDGGPYWIDHREHRKTSEGVECIVHPYEQVWEPGHEAREHFQILRDKGFRVSVSAESAYSKNATEILIIPPVK